MIHHRGPNALSAHMLLPFGIFSMGAYNAVSSQTADVHGVCERYQVRLMGILPTSLISPICCELSVGFGPDGAAGRRFM